MNQSTLPRFRRMTLEANEKRVQTLQKSLDRLARAKVSRWNAGSALGFNIVDVAPQRRRGDRVIVFPMSFDYRIDPLVVRRLQVLSAVTERRVIGVETPGVTMDPLSPSDTKRSTIEPRAYWSAVRGDYTRIAQIQLEAIEDVLDVDLKGSRLVGESLGAQLASSMATLRPVASVDLVEPVNAAARRIGEMLRMGHLLNSIEEPLRRAAIVGSTRDGWSAIEAFEDSSELNRIVDRKLKRFWRQGVLALGVGFGLRRPLDQTLIDVPAAVPIGLWFAAQSTVCSRPALVTLATKLQTQGHQVCMTAMEAPSGVSGHHVLTGMTAMAAFAASLNDSWS